MLEPLSEQGFLVILMQCICTCQCRPEKKEAGAPVHSTKLRKALGKALGKVLKWNN